GRVVAVDDVMAGVEFVLGGVVVVGHPHRADDGQVIDAGADVRPPVADLDAALAPFAVADLHGIDLGHQVARHAREVADVAAVVRRFQGGLVVRRLGGGAARGPVHHTPSVAA